MTTIEERQIKVGDLVFDARTAGPPDGRLVLLLHGWPQSSYEWRHQLRALGDAGYHAVAPDQRGYSPGARPAEVEAYAPDHLIADALAIADELGGHQFDVVGHDWGAVVSWAIAAKHPGRVRTLTSVSVPHTLAFAEALFGGSEQATMSIYMGFFQAPPPGPEDALLSDDAAVLRAIFTGEGSETVERWPEELRGFAHGGHLDPAEAKVYIERMREPGALTASLNWYRAMGMGGLEGVDQIEVPTLFAWSTGDVALGPTAAHGTGKYVTGPYRFEVLEGVSHWIPEEAPERFTELLLEHLAAHG